MTLAIAIIGAVTGVASLVWQAWSFLKAGPQVHVTNSFGIIGMNDGSTRNVLILDASNRGRMGIEIRGWGFELPNKSHLVPGLRQLPISTPIPHHLEPGHSASWHMFIRDLAPSVVALSQKGPLKLRGWVSLGTAKKKFARKPLDVSQGGLALKD